MRHAVRVLLVTTTAGLGLAACGGSPPPGQAAPAAREPAAPAPATDDEAVARREAEERRRAEEARRTEEARVRAVLQQMVFFDFDRSDIRPADRPRLDAKVTELRNNRAIQLQIDGHADERGSDEYNMALGMRRAISVRQYLMNHGIDGARLTTRSFGEERPLDLRSTPAAWDQNRRAEFQIVAGLVSDR